jgi:hypothetical protein
MTLRSVIFFTLSSTYSLHQMKMPEKDGYGTWPGSGEIDIMESRGNSAAYKYGGRDSISSTLHWGIQNSGYDQYMKTTASKKSPSTADGAGWSNDFHIYGLKWTATKLYTYIDDDSNRIYEIDFTAQNFWQRANNGLKDFKVNPWASGTQAAPFDQPYYLIINLAVGGTNGWFPDDTATNKPWTNTNALAHTQFWNASSSWLPTWTQPTFEIDFVRMYQ